MKLPERLGFQQRSSLEDPRTPISNPAAWLIDLFGGPTTAGVHVSAESILMTPVGWRCVNLVAETIASLPLNLYRRVDGGRELMRSSPLFTLLHDRPNPELTSFRWRRLFMRHLLLKGRHFSRIERNNAGRPTGLFPLKPEQVTVERQNGRLRFKVEIDTDTENSRSRSEVLSSDEVLHFSGLEQNDGLDGEPIMSRLRNSVALTIALETYGASFFKNGARVGLAMEYPGKLSDPAIARLKKSIEETHGGVTNSHKVFVLEDGAKLHKITTDPESSQFTEARELQRKELANILNVPLFFIGDSDPAKANSEQLALFFVKHTIRPWLVMLEQEMNLKLLSDSQVRTQNIESNVVGILRGDFKTRMEGYASGIQNGVLKPNEARERENLPADPNGNNLMLQQNMTPVGQLELGLQDEEDDENDE